MWKNCLLCRKSCRKRYRSENLDCRVSRGLNCLSNAGKALRLEIDIRESLVISGPYIDGWLLGSDLIADAILGSSMIPACECWHSSDQLISLLARARAVLPFALYSSVFPCFKRKYGSIFTPSHSAPGGQAGGSSALTTSRTCLAQATNGWRLTRGILYIDFI